MGSVTTPGRWLTWRMPPRDPRVSPLRGNLADGATGAYVELVPAAGGEAPTPGCVGDPTALLDDLMREGHFCAQLAPESIEQRVAFLRSAVRQAPPVVIDPLGGTQRAEP